MKVLVLYRPSSERGRVVEEFVRDLEHRISGATVEVVNIDSRDGSATASLYDIMDNPAILVLQNDGYMHKAWQGMDVPPMIDEVASYARM